MTVYEFLFIAYRKFAFEVSQVIQGFFLANQ